MFYCQLKGGLGNQLFQFGAALRLARNDIKKIKFVTYQSNEFIYKLSSLLKIQLPEIIDFNELTLLFQGQTLGCITDNPAGPYVDQNELDFSFSPSESVLVDGYFQSSPTILQIKKFIAEQGGVFKVFDMPTNLNCPSAIHYRLGDYKRLDVQREIGILNPSYIDRALVHLLEYGREIDFYTDDVYIADIYKKYGYLDICQGGDDITAFKKMLLYKNFAISNSSFSLLAASLSEKIENLIRPAQWKRNILHDSLTDTLSCKVSYLSNSFIFYDNNLNRRV